jgi:hypothetical protein
MNNRFMNRRFAWARVVCASACASLAACQLNDTDSAPPAPDDLAGEVESETAQTTSPAQSGTEQPGAGDVDTTQDDGMDEDDGMPGPSADASFAPSFDASFPVLPSLDAGALPPGTLAMPDAGPTMVSGTGFAPTDASPMADSGPTMVSGTGFAPTDASPIPGG